MKIFIMAIVLLMSAPISIWAGLYDLHCELKNSHGIDLNNRATYLSGLLDIKGDDYHLSEAAYHVGLEDRYRHSRASISFHLPEGTTLTDTGQRREFTGSLKVRSLDSQWTTVTDMGCLINPVSDGFLEFRKYYKARKPCRAYASKLTP